MDEIFWIFFWGVFGFSFGVPVVRVMINIASWILEALGINKGVMDE